MAEQPAISFAGLLRQLRARAQLTQEEPAEAAGLSPQSVSDLERGVNRTVRKDTAVLLAGALGVAESAQSLFVAADRRAPSDEGQVPGPVSGHRPRHPAPAASPRTGGLQAAGPHRGTGVRTAQTCHELTTMSRRGFTACQSEWLLACAAHICGSCTGTACRANDPGPVPQQPRPKIAQDRGHAPRICIPDFPICR